MTEHSSSLKFRQISQRHTSVDQHSICQALRIVCVMFLVRIFCFRLELTAQFSLGKLTESFTMTILILLQLRNLLRIQIKSEWSTGTTRLQTLHGLLQGLDSHRASLTFPILSKLPLAVIKT